MWLKLVVFSLFLCVLFVLSRLREAIAYYEGGYLASRLLDPVSLSAKKLKLLLDQRGISYAGVVEKFELKQLVEKTGNASEGELESASREKSVRTKFTEFKGGSHFYEEVEDCKDSVWVVQVVHEPHSFMSPQEWTTFVHKVSRFGVHTGLFDCSLDPRLCEHKGWYTPRLILALPQGQKAKDNVVLKNYVGSPRTQAALDWVNYNLASRVREIQSAIELEKEWLSFKAGEGTTPNHKLRVVLLSTLNVPPMFYSVLSLKFTGRARFGLINVSTVTGRGIMNATRWRDVPKYLVIMPEKTYEFGLSPGEYPNFASMSLFLKSLQPEVNDIFLLALVVVNVMCWFEVALSRGNIFKRLGSLLWHVCKWNCLLILLCFPVLAVFQLPCMSFVLELSLVVIRRVSTSFLASMVRADWIMYYVHNIPALLAIFLVYAALVAALHYRYRAPDTSAPSPNAFSQLLQPNIPWDSYASFLFQPLTGASPFLAGGSLRGNGDAIEMDLGMEMLIERLSSPNIWLHGPVISNDYLRELPVWVYTGPSVESDLGSDCDSGAVSACPSTACTGSHGENHLHDRQTAANSANPDVDDATPQTSDSSLAHNPALFMCEKCRALREEDDPPGAQGIDRSIAQQQQAHTDSVTRAKLVMDSNYCCMCRHGNTPTTSTTTTNDQPEARTRDGIVQSDTSHQSSQSESKSDPLTAHSPSRRPEKTKGSKWRLSQHSGSGLTTSSSRSDLEEEGQGHEHYLPPPGMLPFMDCSICLEGLKHGVSLCGLPCKHSFHQECIMLWLQEYNHLCPLCRWPAYKAKPCSLHQHAD